MTVNGKDIKKSEFDYIYSKNNNEEMIDKKSLEEYVELFKNFKLKVVEAETQGLDTTSAFKSELTEYRTQLAKPYLSNLTVDENLIKKEYDRLKEYYEVAHIAIFFPREDNDASPQLLPADTLDAYNKINQVYSRLKNGEDFSKLVLEYSEDARSKENVNPGLLGWVSGMMLHPTLENAVFSLDKGQFGAPVRTHYGYHLFKVLDKKPNPGQLRVSHILVRFPENADDAQKKEAQTKINEVYQKILAGEDFAEMAREYSEDGSAARGGELNFFGLGNMVPEFEETAYALKNINDVSKPFTTFYGYHIVKLLEKKPLESFEEKKQEITSKFSNSGFFLELHEPAIEELQKANRFVKNDKAYELLMKEMNEFSPLSDAFLEKYANSNETLFSFGDKNINIADFIQFLKKNNQSSFFLSIDVLKDKLNFFEYDQLIKFENQSLEEKYPEFRNLMQEYRDGILMFEVTNKEVWNKASEDVEGLERFFAKNKKNYKWTEPHYKGYVVLVRDADVKKKIQKETAKMKPEAAIEYMLGNYKVGSVSYVKVEKGLFKKGDNAFVDEAVFKTGKASFPQDYQDFFLLGKTLKSPESYADVRGLVITDYQDYLETEWLKKLNSTYPVILYEDVIFTEK